MAGDSAVDRAFDTIELLESILLRLPARDLLLAQRVCRSWRAVIACSLRIQKRLFYRPVGLLEASPGHVDDDAFTSIVFENPFFRARGSGHADQWAARFHGDLFAQTLGIPRLADVQIWDRPGASWKKMLMCQPAMRRIRMCGGGGGGFVDLTAKDGVTAGMVFKIVKKWRRRHGPFFRHVTLVGRRQWQAIDSDAQLREAAGERPQMKFPSSGPGKVVRAEHHR